MSFLVSVFKPLAYLSLPIIAVRAIAAKSPTGRYYVRVGLFLGTVTVVAACSAVLAAGMSIIGLRFNVNFIVARSFYYLGGKVLDIHVEVEGEEHLETRPAIMMANHQSMLDVLILGKLMPWRSSIMAKKSLQLTPLGPFMTMSGAIFVDRGNNARAVRSLEAAGESINSRKISLFMYPEGTRHSSEVPDMLPLKKGGFHLAIQAGIPIVPVVTENYWRIYRKGVFGSGTLKVRVLPPIPTTDLTAADVSTLAIRVRDQMLAALRDISVKVPPGQQEKAEDPLHVSVQPIPTPLTVPVTTASVADISSAGLDAALEASRGSKESLASSSSSNSQSIQKYEGSENGTETEEDEGMVLVGRPV